LSEYPTTTNILNNNQEEGVYCCFCVLVQEGENCRERKIPINVLQKRGKNVWQQQQHKTATTKSKFAVSS